MLNNTRKGDSKLEIVQLRDAHVDGVFQRTTEQEKCRCIL